MSFFESSISLVELENVINIVTMAARQARNRSGSTPYHIISVISESNVRPLQLRDHPFRLCLTKFDVSARQWISGKTCAGSTLDPVRCAMQA